MQEMDNANGHEWTRITTRRKQARVYYPPPPVARPRLVRVGRLAGGGCSVIGDAVSVCLRFRVALAIEGVLEDANGVVADVEAVPGVEEVAAGCGTVLFCFRGELVAEPGAFCGVVGGWAASGGGPIGGGTLEYKVTAGVGGTPFNVWKL